MSKKALQRLQAEFGDKILETSDFRGDETAVVALKDWVAVATFLRDDSALDMALFGDLTAVDYPEREPEAPRFELVLYVRSVTTGERVRIKTPVKDGQSAPTLINVWAGANWAEREIWDMFGIKFDGHPDLRRILMYDEFEGHPLRKDYPIERTQPLVPYREGIANQKQAPFGAEEGQPFGRIRWQDRLDQGDKQVSPAIALQQGQRRSLVDSEIARDEQALIQKKVAEEAASDGAAE